MFQNTLTNVRKYGSKAIAAAGTLALSTAVMAQEVDPSASILAGVDKSMLAGAGIATAVVLGLYVIFGIKLLWRSK